MTPFKMIVCWSLLFFLAASSLLRAQGKNSDDIRSCRAFVQEFYDWYLRQIEDEMTNKDVSVVDLALTQRKSTFGAELLNRLRKDSEAQSKVPGEIVGLEFDPFLNSQDPDERYIVGNIRFQGKRYWAEVYG